MGRCVAFGGSKGREQDCRHCCAGSKRGAELALVHGNPPELPRLTLDQRQTNKRSPPKAEGKPQLPGEAEFNSRMLLDEL